MNMVRNLLRYWFNLQLFNCLFFHTPGLLNMYFSFVDFIKGEFGLIQEVDFIQSDFCIYLVHYGGYLIYLGLSKS